MSTPAIYGGDQNIVVDDALRQLLQVQPPEKPEDTPPVFSFTRKREIHIPWSELVDAEEGELAGSLDAMREFFESSWWTNRENGPTKDDLKALVEPEDEQKQLQMIGDLQQANPEPGRRALAAYRARFEEAQVSAELISEGVVFRDGTSGRRYLVHSDEPLSIDEFLDPDHYRLAWDKITGFELVYDKEEDAKKFYTSFEEIDLRPTFIEQRFKELEILWQLADTVDQKIPELSAEKLGTMLGQGADVADVEQVYQRFLRLRMNKLDVDREFEKLVSFTAQLGYFLYREDTPFTVGNQKIVATKGKVHSKVKRTVQWSSLELRPEDLPRKVRFLARIPIKPLRKILRSRKEYNEVGDVPEPVDTSSDRVARWQDQYREKHPDAEVFLFDRGPGGYVTPEGVGLSDVVDRCRVDEDFRRRCAIMLPIYEQSLRGIRVIAKYHIFERPMPGISPTILPRLSLVESLSYRTAWRGLEVGEMASAVNLAPGERRTVRITKSFEQEKIISTTSTSLFELEEKAATDLSSVMESEFTKEQKHSASASLEAKVKGTSPTVTAQASAKAGVETSTGEFAKTINKVAKNAAKSVSSRNRRDVSSATSARTTIKTTDETEATLENINQGRTLNLLFYRLYNRYQGGLYMDDLQFEIIPSCELIEGSGVYDSLHFGFGDLERVVDELDRTPLPWKVDRKALCELIVNSIESLLTREYAEKEPPKEGLSMAASRGQEPEALQPAERSIEVLRFCAGGRQTLRGAAPEAPAGRSDSELTDLAERLKDAITTLKSGKPVEPIDLVVATPGFYLDAVVGRQPSTEPYSELMREQEVHMRAAEVFAKRSEGVYQQAKARRIANLSSVNWGTGYLPDSDGKGLTLSLEFPLQPGDWQVTLNGETIGHIDGQWHFRRLVKVSLNDGALLETGKLRMLELIDRSSEGPQVIPFLDDAHRGTQPHCS